MGATVLLHGRNAAKGEAAMREIREETGSERLRFYLADFASLAEVRELAERVLAEHERLDVLVNNAGIGTVDGGSAERAVSEDGHELRFAVNYLAPFLLTHLLEPLLVRSAPARIVNVASAGQAPIDFDNVMLERNYSGVQAYCQSKLALVMLTFDLAGELRDRGVMANCLHPGTYMPTKMVLEAGVTPVDSLAAGVEATLRLVADPELSGFGSATNCPACGAQLGLAGDGRGASAIGVQRVALRAEHEVALGVRHVIAQQRRQRLDECQPTLGVQLVLDSGIHDHNIPCTEALRLLAHRHRDVAFDDPHHLLGGLVRVPPHRRPRLVHHMAEQHLLSADCAEPHTRKESVRLHAVP